MRFNNSYDIRHFCDEQALNSLHFLTGRSAGFLRTLAASRLPRYATTRGPYSTTSGKSCDHVRGRHFLVLCSRGPIAVSASIINRFGLRFVGSDMAFSAASGDGPLGTGKAAGSAVPSMTFAASPARAASMVWMSSMACSISSSLIALTPPECSTFTSRGHNNVNSLQ